MKQSFEEYITKLEEYKKEVKNLEDTIKYFSSALLRSLLLQVFVSYFSFVFFSLSYRLHKKALSVLSALVLKCKMHTFCRGQKQAMEAFAKTPTVGRVIKREAMTS